jgi:hypothetical protein
LEVRHRVSRCVCCMPAASKRSSPAVLLSLRMVRCDGIIAVRYDDWRRPIAALLGVSSLNFRPLFSGLFSFLGSPVLAEPLCSLQVEHPNRHAVCHQSMIPRLLGQPLALSLADEGLGILPKVTLREPSSATHEKLRAPVT